MRQIIKNAIINDGTGSAPFMGEALIENDRIVKVGSSVTEEAGRVYDCYPKFLRDALPGTGDTMPNTIRRMTGAIADRFMLPERGCLKKGYFADLTVFDEDEIRRAVPDRGRSFGIEKLFVNGRLVPDGSRLDKDAMKTAGRAVRVL